MTYYLWKFGSLRENTHNSSNWCLFGSSLSWNLVEWRCREVSLKIWSRWCTGRSIGHALCVWWVLLAGVYTLDPCIVMWVSSVMCFRCASIEAPATSDTGERLVDRVRWPCAKNLLPTYKSGAHLSMSGVSARVDISSDKTNHWVSLSFAIFSPWLVVPSASIRRRQHHAAVRLVLLTRVSFLLHRRRVLLHARTARHLLSRHS